MGCLLCDRSLASWSPDTIFGFRVFWNRDSVVESVNTEFERTVDSADVWSSALVMVLGPMRWHWQPSFPGTTSRRTSLSLDSVFVLSTSAQLLERCSWWLSKMIMMTDRHFRDRLHVMLYDAGARRWWAWLESLSSGGILATHSMAFATACTYNNARGSRHAMGGA